MPNFTKPPGAEGPKRWNSGPPYLATVRDMYRIVVLWTELAPRVLRMHDHLFAGTRVCLRCMPLFSSQEYQVSFVTHRCLRRARVASTEMYGLIFAAHQLNLPFTLVKSFVVSETASRIREGWEYIDQLRDEDVCQPLSLISKPLPVTLHYCERYAKQNCCTGCEAVTINAHHCRSFRHCHVRAATCSGAYVRTDCHVSIDVVPTPSSPISCRSSSSQSTE